MYRQSEKKLVKQQYLLHMFSQCGELRSISSWDRFTSLKHPSKFQRVSGLRFVTVPTSLNRGQPNFAQCLAVSWAATLGPMYTFSGALAPKRKFARCKIHLCPTLTFSYIGSVTAWHSNSGRQPNFVAWYREWNYWTFAEGATYTWLGGHHVGHRLTFQLLVYFIYAIKCNTYGWNCSTRRQRQCVKFPTVVNKRQYFSCTLRYELYCENASYLSSPHLSVGQCCSQSALQAGLFRADFVWRQCVG